MPKPIPPVISADQGRRAAGSIATALGSAGLSHGDRVLLAFESSWQKVACVWACISSGLVPVPVDPKLSSRELATVSGQTGPSLVLSSTSEVASWLDLSPSEVSSTPSCRPMHMTSGTTGEPKGVWSGWWTQDEAESALEEERALWGFGPHDLNLVVSPLHHSAPLRFALNTWLAGGAIVVLEGFDAQHWWTVSDTLRPTTMFCVPSHLHRIISAAPENAASSASSYRLVAHAGAPCPDSVRRDAHGLFGPDVVWEFYGSTEGQFTACSGLEWQAHGSGVGRVRPGRRMFTDEGDQLWCTVPPWGRFEYWADPARTVQAWQQTPDGPAFTVGDLGSVSEDGWVQIWSRRTDLVITGGVNVYPAEVESVLEGVPGVFEVAVHGVADPEWGQRVVATVVGSATEEELRARAAVQLVAAKRPKTYLFVDRLPRTPTGKIRRQDLAGS